MKQSKAVLCFADYREMQDEVETQNNKTLELEEDIQWLVAETNNLKNRSLNEGDFND